MIFSSESFLQSVGSICVATDRLLLIQSLFAYSQISEFVCKLSQSFLPVSLFSGTSTPVFRVPDFFTFLQ
jgi:hypothetical protein